jgi:DNA-binding response OmpR family regulator
VETSGILIFKGVKGYPAGTGALASGVDHIHRLRRHLSISSAQIITLRGLGYILRSKDAT